tara:strand:- start:13686 stop:15224 length:1539 start_codon:yes stop_codon:yes gene_type:complete
VPFTNEYLKEKIISHQEFPSLLSISESLEKYNIENVSIKTNKENLEQIPLPCIVQVFDNSTSLFFTIESISENKVRFYDENGKSRKLEKDKFLKMWTGVALIAEKNDNSYEPRIKEKIRERNFNRIIISLIAFFAFTWICTDLSFGKTEIFSSRGIITIFIIVLHFLGLIMSYLALLQNVNESNPLVNKFCIGGENSDCNSVLKSPFLSFFNGKINLSSISFSYFVSGTLYIIFHSFSVLSISFLSFLTLLTIPVILASFYYQLRIVKKWCSLCLSIQIILISQGALFFFLGNSDSFQLSFIPPFGFFFLTIILLWSFIMPYIGLFELNYSTRRKLNKIKFSKEIFRNLLSTGNKISSELDGLGIKLENQNAKYKVVKVCNPFCGPCSSAHPILEKLYDKGLIDLQILFFPDINQDDIKTKTISHFLAIDSLGDSRSTKEALDYWYNLKDKKYETFAKKYHLNGIVKDQYFKLNKMREWCQSEKIKHTPTIFINGYELPEEYSFDDLPEILN